MKKKLLIVLSFCLLFGCENNNINNGEINNSNQVYGNFYPSIKVQSSNPNSFYLNISTVVGDFDIVGHGDTYYYPALILRYNNQGKLDNFSIIGYFLDNKDDYKWADIALETYNSSSAKIKGAITNVQKGRVNDFVSYVKYDFKYDKNEFYYNFNQFIDNDLIYKQDIEEFKNDTCYSRFYNYDVEPKHIDEEKHFYCSLEDLDVYWSNENNAYKIGY